MEEVRRRGSGSSTVEARADRLGKSTPQPDDGTDVRGLTHIHRPHIIGR
jgi:hypothetical protein